MSKKEQMHLMIPIMMVQHFEDEIGEDGQPIVVAFVNADFYFKLTSTQWEKWQYTPVVNKAEGRQLTIEEKIAAIQTKMREDSLAHTREPAALVLTEEEEESERRGYYNQDLEDIKNIVGTFKVKKDDLSKIVLVNDEAGPDGSMLDREKFAKLCVFILKSIEFEKGSKEYNEIAHAKQVAFNRLKIAPYVHLMSMIDITPPPIRQQIAAYQMRNLGTGPHGEGGNWTPSGWAAYIQGDKDWDEKEYQSFFNQLGTWHDHKPPVIKNAKLAYAVESQGFDGADKMSLNDLIGEFDKAVRVASGSE